MRQKQMLSWFEHSKLDLSELNIDQLFDHVRKEAANAGLNDDEQTDLVTNLNVVLTRTKTTNADLMQKLRNSAAIFAVLQDLMSSKAAEVAAARRRSEVQAVEAAERHQQQMEADLAEAERVAQLRRKAKLQVQRGKQLEGRYKTAAEKAENLRSAAMKQAKAFVKNLQALGEHAEEIHGLEQDLLALESSAPEECPELAFSVEDLRRLRWQNDQISCFKDLAHIAQELLEN